MNVVRLALVAAIFLSGCRVGDGIGESRTDFANGYFWVEHDGESQIAYNGGEILIKHVKEAHADGSIINGTQEDGSAFQIDTRSGALRKANGVRM